MKHISSSFVRYSGILGCLLLMLAHFGARGQATTPCAPNPACSDTTYNFASPTGQPSLPGPNYGCLFTSPNPTFFFMQVGVSGPIQFNISQTSTAGVPIDVDFAMWGPFPDVASGCIPIMSGTLAPLQCSYSAAAVETAGIGLPGGTGAGASTPPAAVAGQVYIIVITNFNGGAGTISFGQTAGTGQMDCNVICGLSADNNGPVCAGSPLQLTATNTQDTLVPSGYSYHWTGPGGFTSNQKNPQVVIGTAGTYTFNVMSISPTGDTCNASTDVDIKATNLETTTVSICNGETYNFFGKELYHTGTYDSLFTNVLGCDSIVRLQLTVNPLPNVVLKGDPNRQICEGSNAILAIANPSSTNTYQWYKEGSAISGETGSQIVVSQAGIYKVIATTDKGCTATSQPFTVVVNPNPVAGIEPLPDEVICAYDSLEIQGVPGPNYEYHWSPAKAFRMISGDEGQTVKGQFLEPTRVTLTVYNQYGCYDSTSTVVQTKPCCEVFVPNAFSPNADGLNDYFNPQLQPGQTLLTMQVYDRFGHIVYNNTNIKKGWNGRYENGSEATADVYMYYMKYTCPDGKLYERKESVTLIR